MVEDEPQFTILKTTPEYIHYSRRLPRPNDKNLDLYDVDDIFVRPDVVIHTRTSKLAKTYPKSGKTGFFFLRSVDVTYSARRRGKNGEPMFRIFNKTGDHTVNTGYDDSIYLSREIARHVIEMVERCYGMKISPEWMKSGRLYQMIAYPTWAAWSLPKLEAGSVIHNEYHHQWYRDEFTNSMRVLSRGFLRSNLRSFVAQSFGKRFVRKDFLREVASTEDMIRLATLAFFRKYFTIPTAIEFLRSEGDLALDTIFNERGMHKKNLEFMLAPLDPATRRRIVMSTGDKHDIRYALERLHRMQRDGYKSYDHTAVDFTNWKTIRKTITFIRRDQKLKAEEIHRTGMDFIAIEQKEHYTSLDGTFVENNGGVYTIQSVKSTDELRHWGTVMHSHIGAYAFQAENHQSYMFGVYDGSKLFANMELNPRGEVAQMYGKFNSSLPEELSAAITAHVESVVTKKTSVCWNAPA